MSALLSKFMDLLNGFELKADGAIPVGRGITPELYYELLIGNIKKIMNRLWDRQMDKITFIRVLESLKLEELPINFLQDLETGIDEWIVKEFRPAYQSAASFAATGNRRITGMMGAINEAVQSRVIFRPNTPAMLDFIKREGVELAVQLTKQQRSTLKHTLSRALKGGWGRRETHLMMRRTVTLTDLQGKWLNNYHDRRMKYWTDYFMQPEFDHYTPAKRDRAIYGNVSREVKIKHKFYQNYRTETIGRTELTRALTLGEIQAHEQAIEAGAIKAAFKRWTKTGKGDNWQSTLKYDGKRIGISESFFKKFGKPDKTTMLDGSGPGEINDRCRLEYDVIPA